jgi:hypothetical protein
VPVTGSGGGSIWRPGAGQAYGYETGATQTGNFAPAGASGFIQAWPVTGTTTAATTTARVLYVQAYTSIYLQPYLSYRVSTCGGIGLPGQNPGYDCAPPGPARPEVARLSAARSRALTRARELLLSLLTEEQARSYTQAGWFEVRGSDGGLFRIHSHSQAGNVQELMAGRPVASYCCHPPGGLPDADAHVAQMLHLQTDEAGFRRTANRTALLRRAA